MFDPEDHSNLFLIFLLILLLERKGSLIVTTWSDRFSESIRSIRAIMIMNELGY